MFDIKFFIIIGLVIVLLFMFKEINNLKLSFEILNSKINQLNNNNLLTNNNPLPNKSCSLTSEIEEGTEHNTTNNVNLNNENNSSDDDKEMMKLLKEDGEAVENYSNDITHDILNNEETEKVEQSEKLEQSEKVQPSEQSEKLNLAGIIYQDSNNQLLNENLDENIETKLDPEKLIREKKLAELQDMAERLNIELTTNGKKKTKIQLANDICNNNNNNINII